jgi:glycosyltransferase involved in cell wall biosynthesis
MRLEGQEGIGHMAAARVAEAQGRMNKHAHTALVLIPAYNEASIIGSVIRQIRATPIRIAYEILVVDDGSTDHTAQEAREAGARTVSLIQNLGYGYALQTGYHMAIKEGFSVVVQMDGDGQHAPESIPDLLEPLLKDECDIVIGSRALSKVSYPMPCVRRWGQKMFAALLFAMCGLRILDPTSGFQAFRARVLRLFTTDDFPGDYPDTNVLLYLHLNGMRIREVPALFRVNTRGTSMHGGVLKPLYYMYKMLFSMLLMYLRNRHTGRQGGRP